MPNNPIVPPIKTPTSMPSGVEETNAEKVTRPINEVKTAPNTFTENIKRETIPADAPPNVVNQVAADSTGKKLTYEQQVEFIKHLPDDLLAQFARRVQETIQAEAVATQEIKKPKLQYITDFENLQESSIFDVNVPIQAIDHQIPEFLNIKLKDSNFSPRWVQTSSKNLGQKRAQGWQYITKEDLEEELKVEIEADAQGHFIYIDAVAMKIPKKKLYTQLRSNYLRAIAMTQQSKLHEQMKATIEGEIEKSLDDRTGLPLGDAWHKYNSEGKMTTYSPLG